MDRSALDPHAACRPRVEGPGPGHCVAGEAAGVDDESGCRVVGNARQRPAEVPPGTGVRRTAAKLS